MIEQKTKHAGGRPPLPTPPVDAAETRHLLAVECVKQNPRTRTLSALRSLLKSYVAAEDSRREDLRNTLLAEQVRIQRELLEVRKADYRRRRELGLQRRADSSATPTGKAGDCAA
jgi:hypothetical protein